MTCPRCHASFRPRGLYMLSSVKCPQCDQRFFFFRQRMLISIVMRLQVVAALLLLTLILQSIDLPSPSFLYSFLLSAAFVAVWMSALFVINYVLATRYMQKSSRR